MTELELYKFIKNNNIEWHRYKGKKWHKYNDEIIICVYFSELNDFYNICSPYLFNEGGIKCTIKYGYVVIPMNFICDYYEIEIENVFTEN